MCKTPYVGQVVHYFTGVGSEQTISQLTGPYSAIITEVKPFPGSPGVFASLTVFPGNGVATPFAVANVPDEATNQSDGTPGTRFWKAI